MATALTTNRIEKRAPNPSRFQVAEAIYESLREIGTDPSWLAVIDRDRWLKAADAALEIEGVETAHGKVQELLAAVEDLEYEVRDLRDSIRNLDS